MHKLIGIKPLVIIMLSMITQLFGNSAQSAAPLKTFPRQVNLSGNIFHFSMPENFSKDMPAADMVETLDINDLTKFDNPEYGNIIRRWWDIKKPGFFGKELGAVMMDISVQRTPQNTRKLLHDRAFDTTDRLDFIVMLYEKFYQRYEPLNKEAGLNENGFPPYNYGLYSPWIGDKFVSEYSDFILNNQKWFSSAVAGPYQYIYLFSTPLTENLHIEVTFTYAYNDEIVNGQWVDGSFMYYAEELTNKIRDSFKIDFANNNKIRQLVEHDWIETTNDELFESNRETLLPALFGPNIFKELAQKKIAPPRIQRGKRSIP